MPGRAGTWPRESTSRGYARARKCARHPPRHVVRLAEVHDVGGAFLVERAQLTPWVVRRLGRLGPTTTTASNWRRRQRPADRVVGVGDCPYAQQTEQDVLLTRAMALAREGAKYPSPEVLCARTREARWRLDVTPASQCKSGPTYDIRQSTLTQGWVVL